VIKARGGNVVLLGLSRMNVERLEGGMPIRFDGAEVGAPGLAFLIVFGETEQAIVAMLRGEGLLDEQTRIDDRFGKGAS
jgi:hypothetical protein